MTEQLKPCPFCGSHDIDESYAVGESSGERHESLPGHTLKTVEMLRDRARSLERKLAAAREALGEVVDILNDSVDVDDEGRPNRAMRITQLCEAALASLENSSPQTTEKPNHQ